MNHKAKCLPSSLLCLELRTQLGMDECQILLEHSKYSRLAEEVEEDSLFTPHQMK